MDESISMPFYKISNFEDAYVLLLHTGPMFTIPSNKGMSISHKTIYTY